MERSHVRGTYLRDVFQRASCEWAIRLFVWDAHLDFAVLQDVASLITLSGGTDDFERRLDVAFQPNLGSGGGAGNTAGSQVSY